MFGFNLLVRCSDHNLGGALFGFLALGDMPSDSSLGGETLQNDVVKVSFWKSCNFLWRWVFASKFRV